MKSNAGQLSQSTIAGFIGAAAFAVLTAGTAVAVSTTAVSITNPSTGVKAHVTGKQSLVTSERDPISGTYAKVDASGRQVVGDGSGPLTVDGTVNARSSLPTKTWTPGSSGVISYSETNGAFQFAVPASGRLALKECFLDLDLYNGDTSSVEVTMTYVALDDLGAGESSHVYVENTWINTRRHMSRMTDDVYPKPGTTVAVHWARNGTAQANYRVQCNGDLL